MKIIIGVRSKGQIFVGIIFFICLNNGSIIEFINIGFHLIHTICKNDNIICAIIIYVIRSKKI